MRAAIVLALMISLGLVTGCVRARPDAGFRLANKLGAPVLTPPGLLYTNTKAPLAFGPTDFGSKVGRATSSQIGLPPLPFPGLTSGIDLFSWGDASVKAAAANGGISNIKHTDYAYEVYVAIFRRFTVEAYGE